MQLDEKQNLDAPGYFHLGMSFAGVGGNGPLVVAWSTILVWHGRPLA